MSESGTDRYALLLQFDNPAASGTGNAPGTQVFSGEGAAYGLGPVAGVSGAGVTHTGGLSAEGSDSSRATGYDDGSGRMARAAPVPPLFRPPPNPTPARRNNRRPLSWAQSISRNIV